MQHFRSQVMKRALSVTCYGLLTTISLLLSTPVLAQDRIDPFGPLVYQRIDVAQLVPPEPAPIAALPPDPVPAAEIALQFKVEAPVGAAGDFCRCVGEDISANSHQNAVRIREALRSPLKDEGIEFTDQPLEEAISLIQEAH